MIIFLDGSTTEWLIAFFQTDAGRIKHAPPPLGVWHRMPFVYRRYFSFRPLKTLFILTRLIGYCLRIRPGVEETRDGNVSLFFSVPSSVKYLHYKPFTVCFQPTSCCHDDIRCKVVYPSSTRQTKLVFDIRRTKTLTGGNFRPENRSHRVRMFVCTLFTPRPKFDTNTP